MGALDPAKIFVILVVALIVLGPERLPRVARELGGVWRQLTHMREQVVSEIREAIPDDLPRRSDLPRIPMPTKGSVGGFVSGLFATPIPPRVTEEEPIDSDSSPRLIGLESPAEVDRRSLVVIHPALGEFAFVPDDPNMN